MRLTKARQLLIQTNMTITEIALATGFSSSTQFSKQYRHIFGTRPSQARLGQTEP
ncbi:helix-turn-helix domain-containing protein [Devosia indica]